MYEITRYNIDVRIYNIWNNVKYILLYFNSTDHPVIIWRHSFDSFMPMVAFSLPRWNYNHAAESTRACLVLPKRFCKQRSPLTKDRRKTDTPNLSVWSWEPCQLCTLGPLNLRVCYFLIQPSFFYAFSRLSFPFFALCFSEIWRRCLCIGMIATKISTAGAKIGREPRVQNCPLPTLLRIWCFDDFEALGHLWEYGWN